MDIWDRIHFGNLSESVECGLFLAFLRSDFVVYILIIFGVLCLFKKFLRFDFSFKISDEMTC